MNTSIPLRLLATAGISAVLATITATSAWAAPTYMSGREDCRRFGEQLVYGRAMYAGTRNGMTLSIPEGTRRATYYDNGSTHYWGKGAGYKTASWAVSAPEAQIAEGGGTCTSEARKR